jgi:hypothetical protein
MSQQLGHHDASITLRVYAHWLPDAPDAKPIDSMRCNHPQPPRNLRGFLMMKRSTLSSWIRLSRNELQKVARRSGAGPLPEKIASCGCKASPPLLC